MERISHYHTRWYTEGGMSQVLKVLAVEEDGNAHAPSQCKVGKRLDFTTSRCCPQVLPLTFQSQIKLPSASRRVTVALTGHEELSSKSFAYAAKYVEPSAAAAAAVEV